MSKSIATSLRAQSGFGAGMTAVAIAAGMALAPQTSFAQDLKSNLAEMLKTHPRLNATRSDVRSAESKVKDTYLRAWTPNVDMSGETGNQKYGSLANPSGQNLTYQRASIKATQQLWDFGKSTRQVAETEAVLNQSRSLAVASEASLLLEALSAHWSYVRADKILEFSRQSEQSVRRQADIESSMVELGKGYESNVLQAKVQLTTAESRRLRAEGAFDIARARVRAVFSDLAGKLDYSTIAVVRPAAMPKSLDEARQMALANNQQIQVGKFRSQAIQERIGSTNAKEFWPRFNVVAETSLRAKTDGVDDPRSFGDQKIYLQFQYTLNAGGAGVSSVDTVSRDYAASVAREVETRQLVEEQVTIAWRNVQVAAENRQTLANLVRISAKYYEMAVAERQMGRRSLLEVLSAELSLINALSDLMSTEADAGIAAITLMQAVGRLDLGSFDLQPVQSVLPKI
ncbi:MAG: TolC family protein [Ramlibacter sp.]|uniref:TolC family protein n=1 Tax=Ramlibacter sp. TaxID=1917967 RepID=UPI0026384198|nr:TolC family protein [Ramlibacter sp.]MDH4377990.1 TolC family protein [Ramlibacter sp.]